MEVPKPTGALERNGAVQSCGKLETSSVQLGAWHGPEGLLESSLHIIGAQYILRSRINGLHPEDLSFPLHKRNERLLTIYYMSGTLLAILTYVISGSLGFCQSRTFKLPHGGSNTRCPQKSPLCLQKHESHHFPSSAGEPSGVHSLSPSLAPLVPIFHFCACAAVLLLMPQPSVRG